MEDRQVGEQDKLTPSVMHSSKITVRRDPKSQDRTDIQSSFHYPDSSHMGGYVSLIVFFCITAGVLFLVIFGLLQARSHQRLCWGHRYEAVPLFYQNGSEKVLLTKEDFDDEDEVYSA